MPKQVDRKAEIASLVAQINKKDGDGSVVTIGQNKALRIARWSTGIEDLDAIIGGGMPKGRVIEIYGAESSGKTSLLYHLMARHPQCLDIPVEGSYDEERAKVFGNGPEQMYVYRARYGEDAMNKTLRFARAGIPLIGIDSVPSLLPKEDAEKVLKSATRDSIEEQRIGGVARLLNKYLPVIEEEIELSGTTVIFVNQVRDKMQAMLFGEKTDTPGGHKLKHSCSIRLMVARKSWIEVPNKNPHNSAANEKVGLIMRVRVVKSKVCNPMSECEIPMFFDRGFVSFDDVQSIRKEIMERNKEQYGKRSKQEQDDNGWDEWGEEDD